MKTHFNYFFFLLMCNNHCIRLPLHLQQYTKSATWQISKVFNGIVHIRNRFGSAINIMWAQVVVVVFYMNTLNYYVWGKKTIFPSTFTTSGNQIFEGLLKELYKLKLWTQNTMILTSCTILLHVKKKQNVVKQILTNIIEFQARE